MFEVGKYYKNKEDETDIMYVAGTGWSVFHGSEQYIFEVVQRHISGRVDTRLSMTSKDAVSVDEWTEITFDEFQEIANSDETCHDICLYNKGYELTERDLLKTSEMAGWMHAGDLEQERKKLNTLVDMCSSQLYGCEFDMENVDFNEFVDIVGKEISNGLRYEGMMKNIQDMGDGEDYPDGPWVHGYEDRWQDTPDGDPLVAHKQRIEWLENELDSAKVEAEYFKNQAELYKHGMAKMI